MSAAATHTPLGRGGEFDRIRDIWRRLGNRATPSGDDAALVELDGVRLAISTDLSIEGTHFLPGWLRFDEIGYRAATAAFSDLAAMASSPVGALASIGVSQDLPQDVAVEVMDGVADAAAAVGAQVWGGDIVRSQRLVLDVVVIGKLVGEPTLRSGAQPGHELLVTGRLGGPAAAVTAWRGGGEPPRSARERFARPVARVKEGTWLRDHGVTAMIDLSDGLLADAGQIAAASGVQCVIEVNHVPRHASAVEPNDAVTGGEEYELLVAVPTSQRETLVQAFRAQFDGSPPLTPVGRVEAGDGVRVEGDSQEIEDLASYEHF